MIQSELLDICSFKYEGRIDAHVLQTLAVQELSKLKAFKFKDVNKICENLHVPHDLVCKQCKLIEEALRNPDSEVLRNENGIWKIINPWRFTQKQLRLHCYYYGVRESEYEGKNMPDWVEGDNDSFLASTKALYRKLMFG